MMIRKARGDGKAGWTRTGTELVDPIRTVVGDESRKQHRVHAGAMAPALRLQQMEGAAMEGIDGFGRLPGHQALTSSRAIRRRDRRRSGCGAPDRPCPHPPEDDAAACR